MDKKFTRAAEKLKEQAAAAIRDILRAHDVCEVDTSVSDSPMLSENPDDGNLTYTLDEIRMDEDDGKLEFCGSNCCDNVSWGVRTLPVETLCEIADWLKENESLFDEE